MQRNWPGPAYLGRLLIVYTLAAILAGLVAAVVLVATGMPVTFKAFVVGMFIGMAAMTAVHLATVFLERIFNQTRHRHPSF